MDITDYTSYNEVRTTVGLSVDELPDTVLAEEIYANALELALGDIDLPDEAPGPGPLSTRYPEIKTIDKTLRTTKEQKLYNLSRMFSTYAVALEVVVSLSMRAPKTVSDSKASLVRFSPEATYTIVIDEIKGKLDDLKSKLENINETAVTSLSYMRVVEPAVDPVTGT